MFIILADETKVLTTLGKFNKDVRKYTSLSKTDDTKQPVKLILDTYSAKDLKKVGDKVDDIKFIAESLGLEITTDENSVYVPGRAKLSHEHWMSEARLVDRKINRNASNYLERWEKIYFLYEQFRKDVTALRRGNGTREDELYAYPYTVWNYTQAEPEGWDNKNEYVPSQAKDAEDETEEA